MTAAELALAGFARFASIDRASSAPGPTPHPGPECPPTSARGAKDHDRLAAMTAPGGGDR